MWLVHLMSYFPFFIPAIILRATILPAMKRFLPTLLFGVFHTSDVCPFFIILLKYTLSFSYVRNITFFLKLILLYEVASTLYLYDIFCLFWLYCILFEASINDIWLEGSGYTFILELYCLSGVSVRYVKFPYPCEES